MTAVLADAREDCEKNSGDAAIAAIPPLREEIGIPSFDRLRHRHHDRSVFLYYAFDLIELNGDDLRREPFEVRKATLASVLAKAAPGLRLNEHIKADGPTVLAHACRMGLEGIVSKRKNSTYRSGPSRDWLKSKNPACAAVKREAEEDWGGEPARCRYCRECKIWPSKALNEDGNELHILR